MELLLSVVVVLMVQSASAQDDENVVEIPKDFLIGAATSAYQTEGAWNQSGKGLSVWDTYVHEHPEYFPGNSSGDVATDSYHKYKEDVKILKELNVDFYRFSISWPRILPKGLANHVNNDGIDYYNKLINELIKNNIQCVVSMHHWDLPQELQDLGGWANPVMEEFFEDYARILFLMFGDRVRTWITFVEPLEIAETYNASMHMAPAVDSPYVGRYLATHTVIKAHARVYRMYHSDFHTQRGMVGIALNSHWFEPKDNSSTADVEAAERALEFELGIFANPIYSEEGDYPKVVKDVLNKLSMEQGYKRSRLRNFTDTEVQTIKGAYDFLGLNYYTSRLAANGNWPDVNSTPDSKVKLFVDPKWPESSASQVQVVPWGIRKLIKWASDKYKSPKIFITENGFPDLGEERDTDRVKYIVSHLSEIMKSKNEDGSNVIGYTVWSLVDSFEWNLGYEHKFGLYQVNRSDPELQRRPKSSAYDFSEICKKRKLPTYFLRVTGEIDVNLTFFQHEKLKNGVESVTEDNTQASSTTLTSFMNPYMTETTVSLTTSVTTIGAKPTEALTTTTTTEVSTIREVETTGLMTTMEGATKTTHATTTKARKRKGRKKNTTPTTTTEQMTSALMNTTETFVRSSTMLTTETTALMPTTTIVTTTLPVCKCNNETKDTEEEEEKNCGRNPPHRKWLTLRERIE